LLGVVHSADSLKGKEWPLQQQLEFVISTSFSPPSNNIIIRAHALTVIVVLMWQRGLYFHFVDDGLAIGGGSSAVDEAGKVSIVGKWQSLTPSPRPFPLFFFFQLDGISSLVDAGKRLKRN
jgi:hypothetical protein